MYCTLRHHLRQYRSALWNLPGGGSTSFCFRVSKWFGVRGSGASGSFRSLTESGLELTIHSTSVMRVLNASSSSWVPALTSRVSNAQRTVRIRRSHVPPIWLEWGTFIWNGIHSQPFSTRYSCNCTWSSSSKAAFNSFRAPTKFVPWLHRNRLTGPRWLRKRLRAFIKEEVLKELAVSKCTLLLAIQVNMTP